MKTITDQLSNYAAYHRDRRNIATHFFGVPMIVLGVVTLLSRPALSLGGFGITPALVAAIGAIGFYLALDVRFGVVMAALFGVALWGGNSFAAMSTGAWVGTGVGLFVVGWVIQFVGHFWEGRKPAFVDDLVGLLVGPLFVVAELGFMIGMRTELRTAIEGRVGPTIIRAPGAPAAQR